MIYAFVCHTAQVTRYMSPGAYLETWFDPNEVGIRGILVQILVSDIPAYFAKRCD
jgi:hypothetical protein